MGKDMVEEFTTRGVLEDDTDILVGLNHIIQSHDVWMFKRAQHLDLTLDLAHAHLAIDIAAPYELDRDLFAPLHMQTQLDLAKLALS